MNESKIETNHSQKLSKKRNNFFEENETMKVIGNSYAWKLIAADGIAYNDLKNLLQAHGITGKALRDNSTLIIHLFILGYVYGIKAERSNRNHTQMTALAGENGPQ